MHSLHKVGAYWGGRAYLYVSKLISVNAE